MKILLLNDNPVVTKLVTLSAQKTDDEVTTVNSVAEISEGSYDLLVLDDAQYDEEGYVELQNKIKFKKSLFICSRDNTNEENFSATIKKPFLPTDLVEVLTNLKKNLDVVEDIPDKGVLEGLEIEGLDDLDDELILDDEEFGESVLDDEEAQKVKELLDDDLNLDYDLSLDLEDEADETIDEELLVQDSELDELAMDETLEDIALDDEVDLDLGELNLEDDALADDILADDALKDDEKLTQSEYLPDEIVEAEEFEENLQTQIEDAVEELSEEDLESEIDEDSLPEIANKELDSFDALNSKDLKAALGEDVNNTDDTSDSIESVSENIQKEDLVENANENRGTESLKTLLVALDNENVVAALKGAKITINISFED